MTFQFPKSVSNGTLTGEANNKGDYRTKYPITAYLKLSLSSSINSPI